MLQKMKQRWRVVIEHCKHHLRQGDLAAIEKQAVEFVLGQARESDEVRIEAWVPGCCERMQPIEQVGRLRRDQHGAARELIDEGVDFVRECVEMCRGSR
jgi:hypothetical protein